jgi:hypothetical protein
MDAMSNATVRALTIHQRRELSAQVEEFTSMFDNQFDLLRIGAQDHTFGLQGGERFQVNFRPGEVVEGQPGSFIISITKVVRL